ncbi:MAG TPA: CHASE3 domain-containing protein, partial [Sphaerochaeta sp.]|nr:CHASE3 domain-containing protein [Sphaerochaeta sp.]
MGITIIGLTMLGIGTFKVTLHNKAMEMNNLVGQTHDILHESALLKISYQNILLHERAYLLTGEEDEILQIDFFIDSFVQHHGKLSSLTKGNELQQQELFRLMQVFLNMHNKVIDPMLQMRSLMEASPADFVQGYQFTDKFQQSETYTSEQLAILDGIEQRA